MADLDLLSSSAKAGDPVNAGLAVIAGWPAFAAITAMFVTY
jgi:hypothetical protein